MKTNLKRILSVICALALCIGLLPMSALAAGGNSVQNEYVKFDYSEEIAAGTDFTVRVQDASGTQLGEPITVSDFPLAVVTNVTITCLKSEYEIMSVETDSGSTTITLPDNQKSTYTCNIDSTLSGGKILVTLCEPFEPPEIVDEIGETANTIVYRIQEPQLLKILHDAKVDIDDIDINNIDVQARYVSNTSLGTTSTFNAIRRGANTIPYYQGDDEISGLDPDSHPNNIRQLEITYSDPQGEHTVIIPSGDLRYVGDGIRTYEIEARDQSEHIVAFYIEPGAQSTTWQLYDVEFVKDGRPLGQEKMPEDPTFPNTEYVFTNWAEEPTGGEPFLPFEEVTEDKVVYAQKTSSEWGGTRYQVMNPDNDMIDRFLEIYNAANGTVATASDVDMESVRIQVNGTDMDDKPGHTNPNYWNNQWVGDHEYYRVVNSHIVGNHDTISNTHIPHDQAESITIFAKVGSEDVEVTIPIDNSVPGGLHIGLSSLDSIAQIFVNDPPVPPDEEDLMPPDGLLDENAVKVVCVTNNEHSDEVSGLLEGSFTPPTTEDIKWESADGFGYYYIDLVVRNDQYVIAYNSKYQGHELKSDEDTTKTIRLKCVSVEGPESTWEVATETPVTFEVVCDNQGSGEDLNGSDVTVQVYVDGQKVTNPLEYVELSRDTKDTDYNDWSTEVSTDGTVTCDFDYFEPTDDDDNPDYDCVDIKVDVRNDTTYLLQGIRSYQSYGESGTNNVRDNGDGTYTLPSR